MAKKAPKKPEIACHHTLCLLIYCNYIMYITCPRIIMTFFEKQVCLHVNPIWSILLRLTSSHCNAKYFVKEYRTNVYFYSTP